MNSLSIISSASSSLGEVNKMSISNIVNEPSNLNVSSSLSEVNKMSIFNLINESNNMNVASSLKEPRKINVLSLLNHAPDYNEERISKKQKKDTETNSLARSTFETTPHKPTSHESKSSLSNLTHSSFTPHLQTVLDPNKKLERPKRAFIKHFTLKTDNEKFKAEQDLKDFVTKKVNEFVLVPENGWSDRKNDGKWSKGLIVHKDQFRPSTPEDKIARVQKSMTLFASPQGKEYIFLKKWNQDMGVDLTAAWCKAYLNDTWKKLLWGNHFKDRTKYITEVEWVKTAVVEFCRNDVSQKYRELYPFITDTQLSREVQQAIVNAFICYTKN